MFWGLRLMTCSDSKIGKISYFPSDDWYSKLGSNVKLRRVKLKLSQKGLALKARLDPNVISRIERGVALPDCFEFQRVAIALGVRIENLLPSFGSGLSSK